MVPPALVEQAWQSLGSPPPHALEQQTESEQNPEGQSDPTVQLVGFGMHAPARQTNGAAQSALVAQDDRQTPAPQTKGLQLVGAPA